ncbi:MAG: sigma-70 family RNA polymerase sigma factor [Thermoanaerobacterales bacterium]|jgi:RNA polymerase sigma factor (sigma-70 family)|nr:sigma-70 family RNA polymerase sigma factor [Thermoanaerobacterales bacterium]
MTNETLAERFEASRSRLHAIAVRLLGSTAEADDAVQEAWLRASRAGTEGVDNVEGWLTTIVSRICLDLLRSRTRAAARAEAAAEVAVPAPSPEDDAALADAIGPALLVVLDALTPAERLAFVLHDLFAVPFDEVAAILRRSPAAARQLASRARRRVQSADLDADPVRERPVVEAFLAAARSGDFAALVELLDPEAVYRADEAAVAGGAPPLLVGAGAVAEAFVGKAQAAEPAMLDDVLGVVVAPGGRVLLVLEVAVEDGRIVEVDVVADPERLAALGLAA